MGLKVWLIKKGLGGKLPDWLYRFIGRKIAKKLNLQEGPAMETKKWYQSKTVLAGIALFLNASYAAAANYLAPNFGWHLPAIPPFINDLINGMLGTTVIYGRVTADTAIAK